MSVKCYGYACLSKSVWQNSHSLLSEHKACQTNKQFLAAGPDPQHPIWGPRHAAQPAAAWLLSIICLSPACHVALEHEARPRICADTYLVGGDPAFV